MCSESLDGFLLCTLTIPVANAEIDRHFTHVPLFIVATHRVQAVCETEITRHAIAIDPVVLDLARFTTEVIIVPFQSFLHCATTPDYAGN